MKHTLAGASMRIAPFRSLRVQLVAGAALLLAIMVAAVGYALMLNQRRSLTEAMIQTVVLQGRNIALSGEKAILRADPEFELCPLVTRVMAEVPDIHSLIVVDGTGAVQGHRDPSQVGTRFVQPGHAGVALHAASVRSGETLHDDGDAYRFTTPIINGGSTVGTVYVEYSKQALVSEQRRALSLTVRLSAAALLVGVFLAVGYFTRISRPMGVLMKGLDAIGRDLSFAIEMPTNNEFRVLAASLNRMAREIQEAQRELLAKERLAHEIELARHIQRSLLPGSVTNRAGLEIGYHYESAYEVGGDYFDIIPVDASRAFFVMADVSGKGVPGMVVMAMTRVLVRQFATSGASPREILLRLNEALAGNMPRNMFVTAFVGVLDTEKHVLSYSNAGHNPLVVYTAERGSASDRRLKGVPLGVFETGRFAQSIQDYSARIDQGDVVLLYTDGLIESVNTNGKQFTLKRLVDTTSREGNRGAKRLVQRLVAEEREFRGEAAQVDDITLLAFGVSAPTPNRLDALSSLEHVT